MNALRQIAAANGICIAGEWTLAVHFLQRGYTLQQIGFANNAVRANLLALKRFDLLEYGGHLNSNGFFANLNAGGRDMTLFPTIPRWVARSLIRGYWMSRDISDFQASRTYRRACRRMEKQPPLTRDLFHTHPRGTLLEAFEPSRAPAHAPAPLWMPMASAGMNRRRSLHDYSELLSNPALPSESDLEVFYDTMGYFNRMDLGHHIFALTPSGQLQESVTKYSDGFQPDSVRPFPMVTMLRVLP